MRNPNGICILLFTLSIALCTAAKAENPEQDTAEKPGVFTLGEVVVTTQRDYLQGTVDQLDDKCLRQFNRDDLAEALDLLPGITVSRTGARNERTIFLRGFDVKHVPLFMDGIPIYVMYDGYSDYGRFTTFDISQIEVSKGAASVLYGPNTMGGAINVVTKRPQKPFEANAGIGVASGDTTTAYANFGTIQGKWYLQGGASYVDRDHYTLSSDFKPTEAEDGDNRENSYLTDKKVNFKVGFQPRSGDEYAFSYSRQEAEKGNPPYAGDDPSQKIKYWQWPQWDKESYYFNSNTRIGEKSYVKTRLYYDIYDNSLFGYDDATYSSQDRKSSFKSWYNDDTAGGSVEIGTTLLGRNNLKTALHYKKDRHKQHDEGEPEQTFRDEYYSIGLEDTITLNNRWSLLAGASYDWQIALEAQDYDSDTGDFSAFETQDASAFNPQVSLFYDVSDTSTAYVAMARKSRFPTLKDRFSYRFGTTVPNPGLDPEIATNYDVGYKMTKDRFTFQGAVFLSDVEDYIQFVDIDDPDDPTSTIQQNQNVGKVYLYGVEANLTVRLKDNLDGGLSYTYTEWDNRSNDEKITGIPEHKINVFTHYCLWEKLDLTADATYYSGRFSSSNGVRETECFTVVNFKAQYALFNGLAVEAGVNNLFDEDYEVDEGFPEEGVSFFTNLTYRY